MKRLPIPALEGVAASREPAAVDCRNGGLVTRLLCLVAGVFLLAACSAPRPVPVVIVPPPVQAAPVDDVERLPGPEDTTTGRPRPGSAVGRQVVTLAHSLVGRPYCWGGESPDCFDCSGLVHYVYGQTGVSVPRTSREQLQLAQRISLNELEAGDLLFFSLSEGQKTSHVGLYAAGSLFIHAPSDGKTVSYASLDNPFWLDHLIGAGRFH